MAPLDKDGRPGQKLRVALLVDSTLQPRWIVEAFAALTHCDFAEVAAIVQCPAARPGAQGMLWNAYARLDRRAFGVRPDPLEAIELASRVPVSSEGSGPIDVAFVVGAADHKAVVARHGTWSFFFGAAGDEQGPFAGLREILSGATTMPCGIKARPRDGGRERIVYQSWSRVFDYSLARTRDNQLPKASAFPARALKSLHEGGEAWLRECPPMAAATSATRAEPDALPPVLAGRVLKGVQRSLSEVSQWFLAYRFSPGEARWGGDLRDWTCLVPPRDRFWADPFPLERAGRHYVFFEELEFARGKAHVSAMEVRPDGSHSEPVKVLERPYHLSYPFLFEHAGALFMIPETGDNRTVEVYRCTRFPGEWTLEKVLLERGFYTDATLHRGEDRWWMFVNASPEGTQGCDELNLFHAADPLGRWQPHRRNPVKSDVRGARPAGALYRSGATLYRPGQIGAPIYGRGVSINRVLRLTPAEYRETEVQRVMPTHPREVLGVHTVNRAGALAVMDGFVRRPRFGAWPCSWGYAHGH